MKDKNIFQKIIGGISGIAFYIVFFSVSILRGCTGGDILRFSLESDGQKERGLGFLLIAVLIFVGLAVILYLIDKMKAGVFMGIASLVGLILVYKMSEAEVKEIEPGGFILLACTLLLTIADFISSSSEKS